MTQRTLSLTFMSLLASSSVSYAYPRAFHTGASGASLANLGFSEYIALILMAILIYLATELYS